VSGLLSLAEARAVVLRSVAGALPSEELPLAGALGRVLAEDVVAAADVPPFANSAMDGFAVRSGPAGRELRVVDESRAGRPARRAVGDGEAVRISTGAPMPEGADAVVPVERVTEGGDAVTLERDVARGANVRLAGEDMRAGAVVLRARAVLGPGELGAAVAAGRAALACARRPRVAIVVTGDELVAPGAPLAPGQIHNSNAILLEGLAGRAGAETVAVGRETGAATGAEPVAVGRETGAAPDGGETSAGVVGDDREATERVLSEALGAADVVVVSGGVSVGPHDHVKPALEALGVEERFWRVALKPGKPVWFGARDGTLVFGLPGNPVSAAVCFALFARPALRALQGADPEPPRTATLGEDVERSPDREQAVRIRLDGAMVATLTGPQGSHMLSSLAGADGLALIPPGEGVLPAGAEISVEPM